VPVLLLSEPLKVMERWNGHWLQLLKFKSTQRKKSRNLSVIDRTYCVTADKAHGGRMVFGARCDEGKFPISVRDGERVQTWERRGG